MIEILFPASVPRCAHRVGSVLLTLAFCTAVLFPPVPTAGVETTADRVVVTLALALVGGFLRFTSPGLVSALGTLVAMGVTGVVVGAPWLAGLAGIGAAYVLPAARPEREAGRASPPAPRGLLLENTEAVALALVLALVAREFAFEAFKIPTASMEPVILGNKKGAPGDRLLANKAALTIGEPERWQIIVFRYPLYRPVNYIKRLIGLPGERVEIRDGDIYVNGVVAAKPDAVQVDMWRPIYPDARREGVALSRAFRVEPGTAGNLVDATAKLTGPADGTAWLVHDQMTNSPDLRLDVTLTPENWGAGAAAVIRLDGRGRRVELELTREGAFLTAPGGERAPVALHHGSGRLGDGTLRLGLGVADRVARVYVGGRQVARVEYADDENGGEERPDARFGVRDGTVEVSGVTLRNDLYYTQRGTTAWDIPDGCYIMLGDNTINSTDSRAWEAALVRELATGTEYVAAMNIRLEDGDRRRNLDTTDGRVRFLDSYGVPRDFAADDVEVLSDVRQPYVRREDLLGRAFLTFYPFPPFGDFRPRFLP